MSEKKTVDLYYDVLSPYSWFAFEILSRYKSKWRNMDLRLKPFSLVEVMRATENHPPGVNPIKMNYISKDLKRLANHNKVPLNMPSNPKEVILEKGSMQAMFFLTAIDMDCPEFTEELSRQLWLRIWSRDEGITEEDHLIEAGKKAGIKEDTIKAALAHSKDKDVADRLQAYTDSALLHGAFGAPTIVVHVNGDKELLFGSDRLNLLSEFLDEKFEGPLNELSAFKL